MMNVYNRGNGTPDAGKNLYPSAMGDEAVTKPDNGPTSASYNHSGPGPVTEGSKGGEQVIDGKGYDAPGEERPGGLIMRDLNNISHDA